MPPVVLLGDSVFENAAYVDGGPDVVQQLRAVLTEALQATLLAVDADIIADVSRQRGRRLRAIDALPRRPCAATAAFRA